MDYVFSDQKWDKVTRKICLKTFPLTIMDSINNYPFILHWVWGHQTKVPPVNISTKKLRKIFYASGPVGVCFDWLENKQYLLFGHKNDITSIAAAPNKKYLVSADKGEENTLIIWNTDTRCIFHIISDYFTSDGIISLCFSPDGKKLMALSGGKPQEISVWDWQKRKLYPDFTYKYKDDVDFQHYLTFHEGHSSHFASCGQKSVFFFEKDNDDIMSAMLDVKELYDEKTSNQIGEFTQTAFSLVSSLAVTATTKGMIILWGRPLYSKEKPAQDTLEWFLMHPKQRVCIRMIQAMESRCPIPFLTASDTCIIAGTGMSDILYYDEDFNIQWSKHFDVGPINSMSVTYRPRFGLRSAVRKLFGKEMELYDTPFDEKDFTICTLDGYVGYYSSISRQLKQILWGTNSLIKSIALHPVWPYIYFSDYNGGLQKWNFKTKEFINKEVYDSVCSQVELITIDNKGAYAACVMSNGNLVIFDAVCFTSKPCFTADEVLHKPLMAEFSPDSQHLIITDVSSYVNHYRLQLLVVPKIYQMMKKGNVPPEEPFWSYGGKTRQHQSHVVDSMFSIFKKNETLYFYTLGEDRFLVQYNISSSKGLDIEVSKRIILERRPVPMCMTWYPLYNVFSLIAVLSDDGKMRIYSVDTEKAVRIVSLPLFEEPIKRIILLSKYKHMLKKEFPHCTNIEEVFEYFIFNCSHIIGISKYPIDGNPNTSLGVTSTPSGINCILTNQEQTFVFTAGMHDSWIFMYEVNIMALLDAEREGGEGVEAFKYLFPPSCDPDEMKQRLIYSVYSLELEMKMLEMRTESPSLVGEIPISCLQCVLAALGCFVSPRDFQLMLKDIDFESKYGYNGEKTTLTCLDVMKLYVNYRPPEPVTKSTLKETFNNILALEEDPDKMPRARFIDVLTTRGDHLSYKELSNILKCLQKGDDLNDKQSDSSSEDEMKEGDEETTEVSVSDKDYEVLKTLMPEFITEEVFFQDILCMDKAEEDLSKYILKYDDYKLVQEYPKLEEIVAAIEKNNL